MSRTKKDRPHHILLKDRTAYPHAIRHEHHEHDRFGQPYYYDKREFDDAEQKFVTTERVLQGHFADYCTVGVDRRDLPPGVLAPCWMYSWVEIGKKPDKWKRASDRARKHKLRGEARRALRNASKLVSGGEDVGDEMPTMPRRGLYSWN